MLSTLEVCEKFNIQREKLRDWISKGYITATICSTKQGVPNLFDKYGIVGILLFERLLTAGFSRKTASIIVKKIVELKMRWSCAVYFKEDGSIKVYMNSIYCTNHYIRSTIWFDDLYRKVMSVLKEYKGE